MSRVAVIAIFAAIAAVIVRKALGEAASVVADPHLRAGAEALYFALKASVAVAFGLFVVLRAPSRHPSRDPIAFVACAAALTSVVLLGGPSDSATTPLLLAGDLVALFGCAWLLASALALGRCFGILPEARGLVTRGPYRLVRHPIYLGELVGAAGLVLASPSSRNAALLGTFAGAQAVRMRLEERALKAEFPEYAAYAAETPRFLPRLRPRRRLAPSTAVAGLLLVAALVATPFGAAAAKRTLAAPKLVAPAGGTSRLTSSRASILPRSRSVSSSS